MSISTETVETILEHCPRLWIDGCDMRLEDTLRALLAERDELTRLRAENAALKADAEWREVGVGDFLYNGRLLRIIETEGDIAYCASLGGHEVRKLFVRAGNPEYDDSGEQRIGSSHPEQP